VKLPPLKLKEGDPAPDFSGKISGGGQVSLGDFKGRHLLLYFYPKDDTPGCTREACGFRDSHSDFENEKVAVLGVSTDPVAAHERFASKYRLPFPLLADVDRVMVNAYGVWGRKSFMGRSYEGTFRVTFLIGPDGRIKKIWPLVKPAEHAREVLEAIRS
jgi:peroxiredoxin Q/BCP